MAPAQGRHCLLPGGLDCTAGSRACLAIDADWIPGTSGDLENVGGVHGSRSPLSFPSVSSVVDQTSVGAQLLVVSLSARHEYATISGRPDISRGVTPSR